MVKNNFINYIWRQKKDVEKIIDWKDGKSYVKVIFTINDKEERDVKNAIVQRDGRNSRTSQ